MLGHNEDDEQEPIDAAVVLQPPQLDEQIDVLFNKKFITNSRWPFIREKLKKLTPLTIGTNNFLTSSIARSILAMARFSVSSTVINTCNLSFKCSQFGLPRFCSSYLY
ncbi:hypothetical protein DERF_010226 [Dermatophagoides farinae]|uniref:Uncharacterized protein n=1 Tax=Dermatophagoides farinae TaxID=6954 RepID=A0A922HWL0_DERFA|nr:hypothetical protein DERF_010226 [Dermatophagoides farinae]